MGGRALPCAIGRSGIRSPKREGDGATPVGRLAPVAALWRPDRGPAAGNPPAAPSDRPARWLVRCRFRRQLQPAGRPSLCQEPRGHDARADALYDLVVVLDWNYRRRLQGRGSAIFLHLARPGFRPYRRLHRSHASNDAPPARAARSARHDPDRRLLSPKEGLDMNDNESAPGIDARTFWRVLGQRATGMTIVTARDEAGPAGLMALSAAHVSADPATMLVSIDRKTAALATVLGARHFAVNFPRSRRCRARRRLRRPGRRHWRSALRRPRLGDARKWRARPRHRARRLRLFRRSGGRAGRGHDRDRPGARCDRRRGRAAGLLPRQEFPVASATQSRTSRSAGMPLGVILPAFS